MRRRRLTTPGPRLGLTLALALAVSGLAMPAAAQRENVREIVLENGMTVLLYPRPGDPNVACGWIAKVGSVNERPGITGLAHLFEHMMFKGTKTIGTKDIDEDLRLIQELDRVRDELRTEQAALDLKERRGQIEDAGDPSVRSERHKALIEEFDSLLQKQRENLVENEFDKIYTKAGATGQNAGTSHDFTVYFINLPANKLELWFWMESDRLRDPVFRQFYSERDVVWEERRMRTDSTPTGRLDEAFDAMFWKASPYSWAPIGWPSDLDGITREEALAFFDRNYSPNNLTAALVGDFDLDEAEALARKYFGRLKRSQNEPTVVRTFEPKQVAAKRLEGEAETRPTVRVRWHSVPHEHVDEPALSVLASLLSGRTGRLYKSLVEDQQVASEVSASQDTRKYGGYFELRGVAAEGHTPEQVEQALYGQLDELREELVPDRELQKVKNQTIAASSRRLNSNFFILLQLLVYDAVDEWSDMFDEKDRTLAVTAEDVQRVVKTYFPEDGRNVAIYRTKQTEGPEDPLWAALNGQQRQMATQIKAQIDQTTDAAQLEQALVQMSAQASAAPPQVQPVLKWAESYVQNKIAELKGGAS